MKKLSSVIWGIVLIAGGAIFALNALNITNIDIFFDGWWTLFIIVPCAVGLFTEREKTGNIIGIAVGIFLLLCCQDIPIFCSVQEQTQRIIPPIMVPITKVAILQMISACVPMLYGERLGMQDIHYVIWWIKILRQGRSPIQRWKSQTIILISGV